MTEITSSAVKKDIQKLQRAIVDGLEDVKGQELKVFDTEHLSSLFERVIIASGTSNRQTKALAASVRDKVREAGFPKPRIEGEANGEWIIVDCGAAVAHVMQPAIRQYYNLEEIWGGKPVRLKFGAPKPIVAKPAAEKTGAGRKTAGTTASGKAAPSKDNNRSPSLARSRASAPVEPRAEKSALKPKKASVKRSVVATEKEVKKTSPPAKKAVKGPTAVKAVTVGSPAPAKKARATGRTPAGKV